MRVSNSLKKIKKSCALFHCCELGSQVLMLATWYGTTTYIILNMKIIKFKKFYLLTLKHTCETKTGLISSCQKSDRFAGS